MQVAGVASAAADRHLQPFLLFMSLQAAERSASPGLLGCTLWPLRNDTVKLQAPQHQL